MTNEEIVHLRSYLTSQSMKRTPAQIYEALQAAYQQFLVTLEPFPEAVFNGLNQEGAWSIAQIVEHIALFMGIYEQAICQVLEQGMQPPDVKDRSEILPRQAQMSRRELLAILRSSLHHLEHAVYQAEPDAHLEIIWHHFELGAMHWREWLLFARVHLLDHVRQLQH